MTVTTAGVAFRHGLMGEVLYGDLLPDERADLHRAIARALSATRGAPASQLAHHWHRAGEHADALAASVAAGLEAARMFAFAEAQGHLERALELWETVDPEPGTLPIDYVELLSRAAQAARFSGDRERAITLGRRALDELDTSVDPARAARLFERLGEAHFWDDETALGWYGNALAVLPAGPSPERARLLAAEGHALMGLRRWAEARARCEQALEISSEIDRHEADAGALTTLGLVLAFLGEPVEGEAHLRRALERARTSGSADDVARAYINLGELLRLRGDHAGALQVMTEGDAFATRAGMRGSFGQFMFVNGADDLLRLGRWDEVGERLEQAERTSLGLTSEAMHRAIAAQLHASRGEVDAARRHLDRALAIADGLPSEFVTPIHTAGALLALVERDPAGARRHVDAGLADLDEMDPLYTPPLLTSGIRAEAELAELARAQRRLADADRALSRAGRLAADADRIVAARPAAPPDALAHQALAHAEVARANDEPAAERWAAAAGRFVDLGEPYPAAYAQLRQAEALLAAAASVARRRGCSPPPTARHSPSGGAAASGDRDPRPARAPEARTACPGDRRRRPRPWRADEPGGGGPEAPRRRADQPRDRPPAVHQRRRPSARTSRTSTKSSTSTRGSRRQAGPSSSASSTALADPTLVHGDLHLRVIAVPTPGPSRRHARSRIVGSSRRHEDAADHQEDPCAPTHTSAFASPQRSPPSRSLSPPAPPSSRRRPPWRRRTRTSRRTLDRTPPAPCVRRGAGRDRAPDGREYRASARCACARVVRRSDESRCNELKETRCPLSP